VGEVEGFYCIHSEVLTLPMSFNTVKRVTYQVSFPPSVMNMMDVLLNLKLLAATPFEIQGIRVSPRQFLEEYLGSTVKPVTGYQQEHKALQVDVRGGRNGKDNGRRYETAVGSNRELDLLSSAFWTSVPHSIVVCMLGRGDIRKRGVLSPEKAVDPSLLLEELEIFGLKVSEMERPQAEGIR
jgi:saccharopine dehydrogenase-like NADP-dependent oxidoreductase